MLNTTRCRENGMTWRAKKTGGTIQYLWKVQLRYGKALCGKWASLATIVLNAKNCSINTGRPFTAHQVLMETRELIEHIHCETTLTSDHYTNYINLEGRLPAARERLLSEIDHALTWEESRFRPFFVGTQ